jgi:hypothetical protein
MKCFFSLIVILSFSVVALSAQHGGDGVTTDSILRKPLDAFRKGHFSGHFRAYNMVTDNARMLSDYHAFAAGGGLHFKTAEWKGLQIGIGGVFHFNLLSSDLGRRDSLSGGANRYEIGLFDVEDPENRYDLDRIEELWVRMDVNYVFSGVSEGLRVQLLYVWKGQLGNTSLDPKNEINRVNMSHFNLIFNYLY